MQYEKKNQKKEYIENWKEGWEWLKFDEMTCRICIDNASSTGERAMNL